MKTRFRPDGQPKNKNCSQAKRKKNEACARIDEAIKRALDELASTPERRAAFLNLLAEVRRKTRVLKLTPGQGSVGWAGPVFLIRRLANLASRQSLWIRPVAEWRAPDGSLRTVFRSLAGHLLTRYAVPGFLDSVWDRPAGAEAFRGHAWFIRAGRGRSLRSLNLPVPLTRRMEHYVRLGPDDFTVLQALRYGEVRGMGGRHQLGCAVAKSRLGWDAMNPAFWRTVLAFLVAQGEAAISSVGILIDFIQETKFAGESVLTADGVETRAAPQPNFCMRGRTLDSLLRLVRRWNVGQEPTGAAGYSWVSSGIQAFRFLESNPGELAKEWSVVELLNSSGLRAEGRAMHHCVATYAERCRRGVSAIWSMRLRRQGVEKRICTVEIDPRCRTIVQVRGAWNGRPGRLAKAILRRWATHAGLEFDVPS